MKANKIFGVVYVAMMGVAAMMSALILFVNASDCVRANFNDTDPSATQTIAFIIVIAFAAILSGALGAAIQKENENK